MEILSYPIGILIGLFPVLVDLGPSGRPAELYLNGDLVCHLTVEAPACLVDLGTMPVPQKLELTRGADSTERWVNRPGQDAEVRATGGCDATRRECALSISWAHPNRLVPVSTRVEIDGVSVAMNPPTRTHVPFPRTTKRPRLLTVGAEFEDGRTAVFTRLFESDAIPETAGASLEAIPVSLSGGLTETDTLMSALAVAGGLALETGEVEAIFVVEPGALSKLGPAPRVTSTRTMGFQAPLENLDGLWLLEPDERLSLYDIRPVDRTRGDNWFARLSSLSRARKTRRLRLADAVAAAGYRLAGFPNRRVVVVVLSDGFRDESSFRPEETAAYLSLIGVPLVVWRIGDAANPGWPAGQVIRRRDDLPAAIAFLADDLRRQRIVWARPGGLDAARLPEGVRLASAPAVGGLRHNPAAPGRSRTQTVYSFSRGPQESILAATSNGALRSLDGRTWQPISTHRPISPAFSVIAAGTGGSELVVGGGATLHRSIDGGASWASFQSGAIFCAAAAPGDPRVVYAGGRAELLRSENGGLNWEPSSGGLPETFFLAIAVHPNEPGSVWVATAGNGVYFTRDGGRHWEATGIELRHTVVRSLTVDTSDPARILAGTDAGVFRTADGGLHWSHVSNGLPASIVYALSRDPILPDRVVAATARGLFRSRDGGLSWTGLSDLPATSVCIAGRQLVVGTMNEGICTLTID